MLNQVVSKTLTRPATSWPAEAEGMDGMIALRASTILNIVMEGAKNPLYEWEKRFEQKSHGKQRGTPPRSARS